MGIIFFEDIKKMIMDMFHGNESGNTLTIKREAVVGVVINNPPNIGKNETRFFGVFLKKLLKHSNAGVGGCDDVSSHATIFGQINEEVGIADIKTFSLLEVCDSIGIILKIKSSKVKKAYEEALKSIGGKPFECTKVQFLYNK